MTVARRVQMRKAHTAPANVTVPVISGTARVGYVITVSTGTWSGNPSSYSYQWKRYSGVSFVGDVGTDSASYNVVSGDISYEIKCSVSATNSYGSTPVLTSSTSTISSDPYPTWTRPGIGASRYNTYSTLTNKEKWTNVLTIVSDQVALSNQQSVTNGANVHAFIYKNVAIGSDNGDQGISYQTASGTYNGVAKTSLGAEINCGPAGFTHEWLLDPANQNVTDYIGPHIVSGLQAVSPRINAIWMDEIGPDYRTYCTSSGTLTFPAVLYPNMSILTSVGSYAYAYRDRLRQVVAYLQQHGYYVCGNARAVNRDQSGGWSSSDTGAAAIQWWDFLVYPDAGATCGSVGSWSHRPGEPIFDAITAEGWLYTTQFFIRLAGSATYHDYWQQMTDLQINVQDRGQDFLPFCEASSPSAPNSTDLRAARYTYASFLLNWDGGYGSIMLHSYNGPDPWNVANISDGNLGFPTGSKSTVMTNVFRRDYDNGYVVVNASSASATVTNVGTIPSGDAVIHVNP